MNRDAKTSAKKILSRKPLTNINSFNPQNPDTVSQKIKAIEEKYETVVGNLAGLKVELTWTKDQLSQTKTEAAQLEKEKNELSQELQNVKGKIRSKQIEQKKGSDRSDVTSESSLPRKVFQDLPCDTEPEMKAFRNALKRDSDVLLYVVSKIQS